MNGLLATLERWTVLYGLAPAERLALALAVVAYVDYGAVARFEPMPSALAGKLGVRTLREAARRFVADRLLGDPDDLRGGGTVLALPLPPSERPVAVTDRVEVIHRRDGSVVHRRGRVCSVCSRPGHNQRTCPALGRAPSPKALAQRERRQTWRGYSAAGERP